MRKQRWRFQKLKFIFPIHNVSFKSPNSKLNDMPGEKSNCLVIVLILIKRIEDEEVIKDQNVTFVRSPISICLLNAGITNYHRKLNRELKWHPQRLRHNFFLFLVPRQQHGFATDYPIVLCAEIGRYYSILVLSVSRLCLCNFTKSYSNGHDTYIQIIEYNIKN